MITEEQFTAALEAAVEQRGAEWVYPTNYTWRRPNGGCRYTLDDGSPACLIGVALSLIDPELVPTPDQDSKGAAAILIDIAPREVAMAARDAQTAQDRNGTWGLALERYKEKLGAAKDFLRV